MLLPLLALGALVIGAAPNPILLYKEGDAVARARCADASNPLYDRGTCADGKQIVGAEALLTALRRDETTVPQQQVALAQAKVARVDDTLLELLDTLPAAHGDAVALSVAIHQNLNLQGSLTLLAADLRDQLARIDAALAAGADPETAAQRLVTAASLGEATRNLEAARAVGTELLERRALLEIDGSALLFRGVVAQRHAATAALRVAQVALDAAIARAGQRALFQRMLADEHSYFEILEGGASFQELRPIALELEAAFAAELARTPEPPPLTAYSCSCTVHNVYFPPPIGYAVDFSGIAVDAGSGDQAHAAVQASRCHERAVESFWLPSIGITVISNVACVPATN